MAIEIKLYQFSKKENSTKRPASDDLKGTFQCRLISPTSITAPSVELSLPSTFSVKYVNYAYIQDFDRYYWISGWTYSAGLWIASMAVDALASWKNGIGNSTQYVTRSEYERNSFASDSAYPMLDKVTWNRVFPTIDSLADLYPPADPLSEWGPINLQTGFFILTVINTSRPGDANAYESSFTTTYIIKPESIKFISYILLATGDFNQQLINGTYKLGDFVLSLKWCPFTPSHWNQVGVYVDKIFIGNQTMAYETENGTVYIDGYLVPYTHTKYSRSINFYAIPEHPQVARGKYLNISPYSTYRLVWPATGNVDINPLILSSGNREIRLVLEIDLRTGNAYYSLWCGNSFVSNGTFLATADIIFTSSGVDAYRVASANAAFANSAVDTIGNGVGMVSGLVNEDYSKAMSSAVAMGKGVNSTLLAFESMAYARIPTFSAKGTAGTVMALATLPYIEYIFQEIADENINIGRPLLKNKKLNTIPGFIQISDPHLELNCTPGELTEINSYMTGGFFYE